MTDDTSPPKAGPARQWLLVAITIILSGWALRATGAFMVPVVFSVFLALLVAPLDRWVATRVPGKVRWLGHVAAMGTILVTLLVFAGLIWFAAQQTMERFPAPEDAGSLLPEIGAAMDGSASEADGSGTQSDDTTQDAEADGAVAAEDGSGGSTSFVLRVGQLLTGAGISFGDRLASWASGLATDILGMAGTALGAIVLVFFLTLIMLIEGASWRGKIAAVLRGSAREDALASIGTIAKRLRRYLLARTVIGLLTGALYAGWLWLFDVDLLVVWALLAFLLNYIPTLGSLIAGVLPVIYAFVQKDVGTAMLAGSGIFVIEQIMGNYIDPRVQGRQVSLSSLVVLITLLVWGWIWGVVGAILAVPITIAAMIVSAHIPALRPFALMLSNESDFDALDRQAVGERG